MGDVVDTQQQQQLNAFQTALAGRYAIIRELGRGGMATVYLAEDIANDRKVAVKLLLPELGASIGGDRFLREIEVGTVLQHPNIVGVLDSGDAAGQLYYVMPYVEGKSLRDRLDQQSQLPIDEAIDITRQVGEALDYAHERGVIHRDIKPENILLDRKRALLADFGIARAVTLAGGETLTQTGMTVGTPTYMSPEQALGSKDVTPESDIYSLACVLYQMLAGQPPFTGPTAMALLARHSLDNVPSLKIVRNTIPDAVEDAIIKAMSKVPADRFHSAAEFVAALSDEEGAAARRQNSLRAKERAAKASAAPPRKRAMIAAGIAVPLLAVSLVAGKALLGDAPTPAGLEGDFAKNNIAVMYFEDRSANNELAVVADGITESLIRELSAVEQLKVISRNGVRPYRGADVPSDSLARALKVGTLVTGTIAQNGDRLRVDLELVDALTGATIDNHRIEQPRDQVLALQDSLARELSEFLRRRVGGEIQRLASRVGTRNSQAWEGMQRASQTIGSVDQLLAAGNMDAALRTYAAADAELVAVEALDPAWPEPIVRRGHLAYQQARLFLRTDKDRVPGLVEQATAHAERALQKAPQDADALELRGTVRYWSWLNNLAPNPDAAAQLLTSAEADFKAATVANSLQASAWNSLSHLLFNKNRTAEGKLAADRAYRADPYLTAVDATIARLFGASLDLNLPTEARNWCEEGRRRFPDNPRFEQCRLQLHMLKSSSKPAVPELWTIYDEFVAASPPQIQEFNKLKGKMFVAIALIRAGLPDSAKAVARSARGNPEIDPAGELQYLESIVLAQAGDSDGAIRLLTRYIAANPQQRDYWKNDETWWLDDIRDDPRFQALISG
jgi:eukaryotic-like serine/threonine-protein kinase